MSVYSYRARSHPSIWYRSSTECLRRPSQLQQRGQRVSFSLIDTTLCKWIVLLIKERIIRIFILCLFSSPTNLWHVKNRCHSHNNYKKHWTSTRLQKDTWFLALSTTCYLRIRLTSKTNCRRFVDSKRHGMTWESPNKLSLQQQQRPMKNDKRHARGLKKKRQRFASIDHWPFYRFVLIQKYANRYN